MLLAEVGQRLVGLGEVITNRLVSPMHFRGGTSFFSLKWKNGWWGLGHAQFDGEALLVVTKGIKLAGISCL